MTKYAERFNKEIAQLLPQNRRAAFEILRVLMHPKSDLKQGPAAEALALANIYHAVANPKRGVNLLAPFLGDLDVKRAIRKVWDQAFKGWPGELEIKEQQSIIVYRPTPGGLLSDAT